MNNRYLRVIYGLSLTDLLLIYFIFMNFMLVAPAVIIGLFTDHVPLYFEAYTVILFVSFLFIIARVGKSFSKNINSFPKCLKDKSGILVLVVILLWSFHIILITLYTPIFKNWDAIAVYLPMAKAIQTTGSLRYNPFFLSEAEMGYPPLTPILYAFIMFTIGDSYLKLVPIIYFLLFILLIYRFGLDFFDKTTSALLVFLFVVMPSTQTYFGRASLFLDLGFAFYLLISIYFFLKAFKDVENRDFWCLMLGVTSGLLFMSKEFGVSLFLVIFSLFIFVFIGIVKNLYVKTVLFAFVAFFPHLFFSIFNTAVRIGVNVHPYYYYRIAIVFVFLFVCSLVVYSVSKNFSGGPQGASKKLIAFLLPAVLSMPYMLYNVLVRGQVSPGLQFGIELKLRELGIPLPSFGNLDEVSRNFFNIQNFFLAFPMAMIFVPLLVSLLVLCYDLKERKVAYEKKILLLFFLYLLFIWGFTGFQVGADNYRRFIPLSVFISLFIAYDYKGFPFQLKNDFKLKPQIQFSLVSLVFAYTWFFVDNPSFDYVPLYSQVVNSQPLATLLNLLIFTAIFIPYIISRIGSLGIVSRKAISHILLHKLKLRAQQKQKLLKGFFVLALLINVLLPTYLITRASAIISEHTWNPTYYADVMSVEAFYDEPLIEVANFYLDNINNSHATVTFGMDRLAYLLKRPFIDCMKYDQLLFLSTVLKTNSSIEIVKKLDEWGIRYFLLPYAGQWAYPIYSHYEDFELFKMVTQQRIVGGSEEVFSFTQLRTFPRAGVVLYELKPMTVTKLKYYFDFEEDPLMVSDDGQ